MCQSIQLNVLVDEIDVVRQPGKATQVNGHTGLGRIELDQSEQIATQRGRAAKHPQLAESRSATRICDALLLSNQLPTGLRDSRTQQQCATDADRRNVIAIQLPSGAP